MWSFRREGYSSPRSAAFNFKAVFLENSIPASTPLVFRGGYSLILVPPDLYPGSVWSLSLFLLLPRWSEFGSTKSPPCAHAPCPANNDDETPRCASSSATGRTEREVSTCPVTLALAASPAAYRSHENKQSFCLRRAGAVCDPRESSFRLLLVLSRLHSSSVKEGYEEGIKRIKVLLLTMHITMHIRYVHTALFLCCWNLDARIQRAISYALFHSYPAEIYSYIFVLASKQ